MTTDYKTELDLAVSLHDVAVKERDLAYAEVERLRNHITSAGTGFAAALGAIRLSLEHAHKDRDALRAEVERLRSRVGWLDHLDTAEGRALHATEAVRVESEQLRAELDEAMLLLGGEDGKLPVSMRFPEYLDRCEKLRAKWMARRAKHKETP